MRRLVVGLVLAGAIAAGGPVAAQSPAPSPSSQPSEPPLPMRVTLCVVIEAPVGSNLASAEGMLQAFLSGIATIADVLVPAQCPAAAVPSGALPSIGEPQNVAGRAIVTVERVKFAKAVPDPPFSPIRPDAGKIFMSLLVKVEAISDGVRTCSGDWAVYADDVVQASASLGRDGPAYLPCDDVPNGRAARGWIDFQVPARKGRPLDIAYTLGRLTGAPGFTITTHCCASR